MVRIATINNKKVPRLLISCGLLLLTGLGGCRKSEYNKVNEPAYLRVFNTLTYKVDLSTKGKPVPFLIMIIDPQYDSGKNITGGTMIGDFLDVRKRYASPTSNAAATSYRNTEFPGTLKIPVAPVINGFDLSNWAQVPSGTHRFLFLTRPINATPFFDLPAEDRQKQITIADTTLNLSRGEVYTMNLLEKKVVEKGLSTLVYLRQEQFHKMAFADSLLYVNFYNLSAEGYVQAHPEGSVAIDYKNATGTAIKDYVNIYYTLYKNDVPYPYTLVNNEAPRLGTEVITGYEKIPLQQLSRSQVPYVAPYSVIPLFGGSDTTGGIFTRNWIKMEIIPPGGGVGGVNAFSPENGTRVSLSNTSDEGRIQINQLGFDSQGFRLPSLIRQAASGPYIQRSFATISSIEFINKDIYLTSVIKFYTPPGK